MQTLSTKTGRTSNPRITERTIMAIKLVGYEQKTRQAVQLFWRNREAAKQKQIESGKADQGERAGVTAGK